MVGFRPIYKNRIAGVRRNWLATRRLRLSRSNADLSGSKSLNTPHFISPYSTTAVFVCSG